MLIRLFKSPAAAWLLITIPPVCMLRAEEPALEIPYFPEVVFKQAPLTLHVRAAAAAPVLMTTNGVAHGALSAGGDPLREVTLFPQTSLRLGFRTESQSREWRFQVLEPGFQGKLTETDGYLYFDDLPVILMPAHRLPPPLDRRWQTVEMVENLMQVQKPPLPPALGLVPETSPLRAGLKKLFPEMQTAFSPPDAGAWFRVHGYLTRITAADPEKAVKTNTDFLVVETDLFDFERGMSPQAWFMKWQFLLQHLEQRGGYRDGLLFSPAYTPATLKWKPVLETKLKGLASAHGLRFVDRSLPEEVWKERLLNQLGKSYRLP